MALDNSPAQRQARKLARKRAVRAPYARLLIVSEGAKTEPHYFGEIKQEYRLQSANIQIAHSHLGTDPLQVVESAEQYFREGIRGVAAPKAFDEVYAVFDRDEHQGYVSALGKAAALHNTLKNDEKKPVPFVAVPSNPCFEFWLLLHFAQTPALLHRHDVFTRLKAHLTDYDKGNTDIFQRTKSLLDKATRRARHINAQSSPHSTTCPYTGVVSLVHKLIHLKD